MPGSSLVSIVDKITALSLKSYTFLKKSGKSIVLDKGGDLQQIQHDNMGSKTDNCLFIIFCALWQIIHGGKQTSKTTFNNDQPHSGKEKDLWLETLFTDYS